MHLWNKSNVYLKHEIVVLLQEMNASLWNKVIVQGVLSSTLIFKVIKDTCDKIQLFYIVTKQFYDGV